MQWLKLLVLKWAVDYVNGSRQECLVQTNYDHYKRNDYPQAGVSDDFTRTNRVLGIGCELKF